MFSLSPSCDRFDPCTPWQAVIRCIGAEMARNLLQTFDLTILGGERLLRIHQLKLPLDAQPDEETLRRLCARQLRIAEKQLRSVRLQKRRRAGQGRRAFFPDSGRGTFRCKNGSVPCSKVSPQSGNGGFFDQARRKRNGAESSSMEPCFSPRGRRGWASRTFLRADAGPPGCKADPDGAGSARGTARARRRASGTPLRFERRKQRSFRRGRSRRVQ